MFAIVTNREDLDLTASLKTVCSWLGLFWQATSVQNFRTFMIYSSFKYALI